MKVDTVSPPIRSIGGYYILALQGRQEPMGTKIDKPTEAAVSPDGTLPLARLLLPARRHAHQGSRSKRAMKIAANLRASFHGCDMLEKIPEKLQGAVL